MIISKSPLSLNNEVYIVLEGGGARGTAFAGELSALEELNIKPLAVVGTSAGAIAAAFIAVGYSSKEISQLMYDKDFQEFLDPVCRIPAWRWLVAQKKQGFYKGDHFQKWLEEKLSQRLLGTSKGSPLFRDLPIPLAVVATDIVRKEVVLFSNDRTPYEPVSEAVRASMSLPGFFVPVRRGKSILVDGGLVSNFPVWALQDKYETQPLPIIGLRLENPYFSPEAHGFLGLAKLIAEATINARTALEQLQAEQSQNCHIIQLPTLGVNVTDFAISKSKKEELYIAAQDRTLARLSKFR